MISTDHESSFVTSRIDCPTIERPFIRKPQYEGTEEWKTALAAITRNCYGPEVSPWKLAAVIVRVIALHSLSDTAADFCEKDLDISDESRRLRRSNI